MSASEDVVPSKSVGDAAPLLRGVNTPEGAASALHAAGVRCCAFDFDLTLLRIHSFGQKVEVGDVSARDLRADFFDLEFVQALIPALRAAGIAVHVCSFGKYPVIQAYMDRACGAGAFTRDTISTPTLVGVPDGSSVVVGMLGGRPVSSKVPQLYQILDGQGLQEPQVLFLDGACWKLLGALVSRSCSCLTLFSSLCSPQTLPDDEMNIELALAAGFTLSQHTPKGVTRETFYSIVNALQGKQ